MVDKHETPKEREERERLERAKLLNDATGVKEEPPAPKKPAKKDEPPPTPNAMGL